MASERSVVVRIRAEIGDFRRQMDQAATATRDMGRTAEQAGQTTSEALTEARSAARDARAALNDAGKAAQDAAQGFGLSYNSAGRLTDQFGNMVTEAHAAELGLETASDATREFAAQQQHAAAELGAATAAAGEATTNMGRLSASVRDHEDAWDKAGATLLGFGAAVVAGVGLAIAKYAEFDKAMSEVRAATHETAGNMQLLRDAAISMGADTAFSAKEAADAISELSKAGVSTKDILNGGLAGALSLAAAGSLGVADAAELAATAMTQFKLKGSDLPHVADLLAAGAGKAQGSVEDMGMALKQGGLVAAATGLTIEETTGTLAAFASAGLIGSDAGTSFKTMLQALTPSSEAASKEMERLGISAYDSQGNFIGMSEFAGRLKTSLSGLTDEQRAATQKIIFGSDAVRASNVLYEQGAEGIQGWIDSVNESGFAASTAAIKQDNLAGDLEKLGGSFDTVLIQGGGGAALALRGLVQGLEDMVDSLGQVKPEFLSLGVGMTGVIGITALLAGGFITLLPKVIATRAAFQTLAATNAPLASGLGKVGKAAGVAMVALLALGAIGAIFSEKQVTSAEEYANAIMKVSAAGKNASSSDLDSLFQSFDKFGGASTVDGINGLSDAVAKLAKADWSDNVNQFFDGFTGMLNLPKSALGQLDTKLKGLGETLGEITSNGGAASAAKTFNLLTEEFKKNGKGAQDALDKMPGYRDALLKLGQASGVALDKTELLELASGKIPARMLAAQKSQEGQAKAAEYQAKMSEEAAKQLEEMGLAADGTVLSLSKLLDAMFASGLIQLSANEAAIKWQESLEGLDASIAKYGTTLDITTEGGKANQRALDGMAAAGIANMKAMADNGATQEDLQGKLKGTYDSLIANYEKFGITGTAADDMARQVLGIPKDVPIETSIQNYADTMAKAAAIKQAVDNINPVKTIFFQTDASGFYDPSKGADGKGAGSGGKSAGTKAYANGGINGAFGSPHVFAANGLHRQSMIARGGANITWAEPETGWEAYISGKPGQESRNRGILQTIAPEFGLEVVPSKSMAGGYGQTQSFNGYTGQASAPAGGGGITVEGPAVTVMIGNEQLESRMYTVAGAAMASASRRSTHKRGGAR